MKKIISNIATVLVLLFLFMLFIPSQKIMTNQPVPDFSFEGLPGRGKALSSDDLKKEVSIINFFGSWCTYCQKEIPTLKYISEEGNIPIHGMNWNDVPERAVKWLKKHGDPYDRIAYIPRGDKVMKEFGVSSAPISFVVDSNGIIRHVFYGEITVGDWEKTLEPLIKKLREIEKSSAKTPPKQAKKQP